jgi:hypothetical protein
MRSLVEDFLRVVSKRKFDVIDLIPLLLFNQQKKTKFSINLWRMQYQTRTKIRERECVSLCE